MPYKNRGLIKGTKLENDQIYSVIFSFCRGRSITTASAEGKLSRVSVARLYRELMRRLVEDPIVNGGVWGAANMPPVDDEVWESLFRCIYNCPSDSKAAPFRYLTNSVVPNRRAQTKQYLKRKARTCARSSCSWQLDAQTFSDAHYLSFVELRWQNRRICEKNFRDIYFTQIFRINHIEGAIHVTDIDSSQRISIDELYDRYLKSFVRNCNFISG